jgi:two-component system sensor histidine kinase VicK
MPAAFNRRILDSTSAGLMYLDLEDRVVFANAAAARLLASGVVEDLVGQPVRTYIQFFGSTSTEVCWRDDGTSFPIEYESVPIDEDGRPIGLVVTFRDISQRRASERLKDEVIAVVSHELRTPLTSIRSALGLLASGHFGGLADKGQRMLDIAVTNTDRLIRLVSDILDLERVDSGKIVMNSVASSAGELMTQAADGVRALAEEVGITLEVRPNDAQVWGDPDRLLQVLTNLLSNAIKFSRPDGGRVWLDAEHSDGELVFRVRDEGRGIPSDKLETIFERFAQVEDGDAREKGGSGLGLAICRGIVKQHGGQIWAESTLGAGTTVCVALPELATDAYRPRPTPLHEGDDTTMAAA